MTIPTLANTRLGYSWLDGVPGKIAYNENRMVLGKDTKAFTLGDIVGFGVKTQFKIPLILEADKKICLVSDGAAMNSNRICTSFGIAGSGLQSFTSGGKTYVIIGEGFYQIRNGTGYLQYYANSSPSLNLFRGPMFYNATS
jgi:hypothetical protein